MKGGRFAFVAACLSALALGKINQTSGDVQYLTLIDHDDYKLDMTWATIRETDTDSEVETTYLAIGLTGQSIPVTGSYMGVAFRNPQEKTQDIYTDDEGNTITKEVDVALKWDGIYCTVAESEPVYPSGLSANLYSNTDDKTTLNLTTVDNTVNQAWTRDFLSSDSSGTTMNCDLNGKGTNCEATTCVFKRTLPSSYETTDITFTELTGV